MAPNKPGTTPLTKEGVIDSMRGHALALMTERGENDAAGQWLWNLANRIERDWWSVADWHGVQAQQRSIPEQRKAA